MSDCAHVICDIYIRRQCWGPVDSDGQPTVGEELVNFEMPFCPWCGVRLADTREGPDSER